MEEEQQLTNLKYKNEARMAALKEEYLIELHKLELREVRVKVELAELQLKKEKERI